MKTGQKRLKNTKLRKWQEDAKQSPQTSRSHSVQCRRHWRGNVHTCWHLKGTKGRDSSSSNTDGSKQVMKLFPFCIQLNPEALPGILWTSKCSRGLAKSSLKIALKCKSFYYSRNYLDFGAERKSIKSPTILECLLFTWWEMQQKYKRITSTCSILSLPFCFVGDTAEIPQGMPNFRRILLQLLEFDPQLLESNLTQRHIFVLKLLGLENHSRKSSSSYWNLMQTFNRCTYLRSHEL